VKAPALLALAAAVLFGASTPLAKVLIMQVPPELLAGLLYLGSGIGLSMLLLARRFAGEKPQILPNRPDFMWLAAAIGCGGVVAPLLMMMGLKVVAGSDASLLLNMEAVFTALFAWLIFRENVDRRIFAGMVAIVCGSLILAWQPASVVSFSLGSLGIIAACFCWALDNNFTAKVSTVDPLVVAASKGLVAGTINTSVALISGHRIDNGSILFAALLIGFFGYGMSLVLFIKALRLLGAARTGAYFSMAPFVGAIISFFLLHEPLTMSLLVGGAFMIVGVWLHLTEDHGHEHSHPAEEHEHMHSHDEHHQHKHQSGLEVSTSEEHSHWHRHEQLRHFHPHYPDLHHRHDH
jgi:drug/metabolite transporter (DMT)-like permease